MVTSCLKNVIFFGDNIGPCFWKNELHQGLFDEENSHFWPRIFRVGVPEFVNDKFASFKAVFDRFIFLSVEVVKGIFVSSDGTFASIDCCQEIKDVFQRRMFFSHFHECFIGFTFQDSRKGLCVV